MVGIEHIWAPEARVGDELLIGPQGFRCETNPTITAIRTDDHEGSQRFVIALRDDDGEDSCVWSQHSRITVFRNPSAHAGLT